ncbi:MAG: methyltransferase domain-containing protein [Wenzhouxiangellaceae bacterium]|nr:methyltransferase domain-containing protein [Wenzhouxiangellaceae bacterium]MBS3824416.1 methyltransferase domain-containing protein [Wenzhouxiangellaceae bacterium]
MRRHLDALWQGPILDASRVAYRGFVDSWRQDCPLVLDSGCGTGTSTALLAAKFPEAVVVGIDQSRSRLSRFREPMPPNMRLVRARAEDFWRLLRADRIRPARHFLLYPNPWPKAVQLKRRWHGHPVFPELLALGGQLELRTNWRIYAEEFRLAAGICGIEVPPVVSFSVQSPLTPFERKYAESGHRLYRLGLNLEETE